MLASAAGCLFFLVGMCQPLRPGRVTFSDEAAPMERLLPALGRAAGVALTADGALKKEVLAVRVRNVSLEQLRERIAEVSGASWRRCGRGWQLWLPHEADRRQRADDARGRAADVREALGQLEFYATWHWSDEQRREIREGRADLSKDPFVDFLYDLGDETLGRHRAGGRTVLCTRPNAQQLPLPAGSLDRLARLTDALSSPIPQVLVELGQGTPVLATITIEGDLNFDGERFELKLYDDAGRVLKRTSRVLNNYRYPQRVEPTGLTNGSAQIGYTAHELGLAQALTTQIFVVANALRTSMRVEPTDAPFYSPAVLSMRLPAELERVFTSPETHDPLAWGMGNPLGELAKSEGDSLVALLPDSALTSFAFRLRQNPVDAMNLVESMLKPEGLEVERKEGWLTVRPQRLAETRDARLDRRALGTALRAIARNGHLTLAEHMAYATAEPVAGLGANFEASLFGAINPAYGMEMSTAASPQERRLLRLLAAMRRSPGTHGLPSKSLRVGALAPLVRTRLDDVVMNTVHGLSFEPEPIPDPRQPRLLTSLDERTFRWPNGVASDSCLELYSLVEDAYFGLIPNGLRPRMNGRSSHGSFGDDPTLSGTSIANAERFVRGSMKTVRLRILDGGQPAFAGSVVDQKVPRRTKELRFTDLPTALQQAIENDRAQWKRFMEEKVERPGRRP